MSKQYSGGIISKTPPTPSGPYETSTASGIWTLDQQAYWRKLNQWPTAGNIAPDAQFNYVTMLLHGDGTNGAQNNTFLDSSSNTFSITRNGNTTQGSFSPYGSNWSNFFAYNSTAVNYLVSSSVSLSGDFTIEGYVYWDGVGSVPAMFTIGDSQIATGIEVYLSAGNWVVYSNNSSRITGSAGVVGQWTYISISRTGSTVTMYINGVSQGTWTSSQTFSGTIKVGAEFYGGGYSSSMSGYISNFRVNNTTAINAVPTAPLTAVSGTVFLTCQSNRFIDNSASPLTITVNGTPSVQRFNPFGTATAYSTATIGGSGYFDGSGDVLTSPDNTAIELGSSDFTMEAWIFPSDNAWQTIATKSSSSQTSAFQFYAYNGYINAYASAGSSWNVGLSSATQIIPQKAWSHIAFTRSGSNWNIWFNGVSVASTTASFTVNNNTTALHIGAFPDGFNMTGYMSDFRLVKGTAVYTSTFTPPTAPLTAITNTSILTNFTNGAIFDNAMMNDLETVGNAQISTSVVKYGTGSLYFDGTGDYLIGVSTPNMNFGSGDFTVEAWVYRQVTSGTTQTIYQKGRVADSNFELSFVINTSNQLEVYYSTSGTSATLVATTTASVSQNTWTHIAVARSGSTWRVFIGGTLDVSATASVTLYTGTGRISIATNPNGDSPFTGYIDDLRITKGYARYTATFTPPTAAFPDIGPT